ncbi:hypothetical protein N752_30080 [Desulforamulus aquiferis]|nr:hypothetical protein [Desulforamulus aquiferis]RYD01247.1 hypothetical protein N752_30080 [Desulforamulus aquiferis]
MESVERYHKRYGYYPEVVQADKIYRNRDNLRYCAGLEIRLSRKPLVDKENRRSKYASNDKMPTNVMPLKENLVKASVVMD